ncbi:beta strand repeat-containing protein [Wukongibacter sp. M2B1]|uniref:beta strand repeat-containing protein n=1 Tax=Wukongibacter sp. M2B1 TaxID=3088895 RepID=UPI003D7B4A2F
MFFGKICAINTTTVQVTLVTSENVTEENLTGKTLTITAGETTLTATYEAGSLVDSKANFILSGDDVLVDATTYTVEGSNFEFTNNTFLAKIADEYIADFEFTTTGLPSTSGAKIYFTTKNQYGEEISDFDALDNELEVTGTMGSFPLTVSVATDGTGVITITDTLVKDKDVSLTLVNKDSESNVIASKTFTATVEEVTLAPAAISSIEIANTTQTAGTTNITLTAKVVDQFGNDITLNADTTDRDIRWSISDTSILEFNGEDNTVTVKDGATNATTISVDTIASGTATVKAYLPDGTEVSTPLVITVTNGDLNSIVTTNANLTVTNKSTVTESNVTINGTTGTRINFQNALGNDIAINADTVSFTVVDSASEDASAEVAIEKVADENGNLSGLKFTTNRADQDAATVANNPNEVYTVTIAVGETTSTFTLTSQIDTAVTSIDAISISAEELTAGGSVVKPIVFRNQYNEMVEVADNATDNVLTFSAPAGVTLEAAKDDTGALAGDGEAITHIKFTAGGAVAADTYNTVIAKEGAIRQVSVPVVDAAELTAVEMANTVTAINDDTAALEDNDLHVVDTEAYVLLPVTFKDQYGNVIDVAANSTDLAVEGDDANYLYKFFKAGDDDSARTSVTDGTAIAYVGFAAKSLDDANLPAAHEIKLTNGQSGDDKVTFATINVTANKSRQLESLTVAPTSGSAVVGAAKPFTLSGIDQYGVAVDLDENNVQLETLANVTLGNKAENGEDAKKADFTLTATTEGNYTAKVFYSDDTTLDAGEKSVNISFTAGELGSAIDHIEIQSTVTVDPDNSGSGDVYEANLDTYKAEITESANNDYTFTVKAYDAANNEVAINSSDILLTVLDNSLEEASAGLAASVTGTTLTVTSTDAANSDEVSGTLTVRAIVNGKTDDMVLTFDSSDSAAQDGTYYLGSTATATDALTVITLDTDDTNGEESVYIVAKDQFGKIVDVDETGILGLSQDSSSYATVTQADPITIAAKAVGSTTLRIFVDADDTITIPVSVDQDAVDARP